MRHSLAALLLLTSAANAEDATYCAQWAQDTLAVGKILTGQEGDNGKLVALLALCLSREEPTPSYTVDTTPKQAKPKQAKKAPPAWLRECERYASWRASDQTVITFESDPKRVPCPAKP